MEKKIMRYFVILFVATDSEDKRVYGQYYTRGLTHPNHKGSIEEIRAKHDLSCIHVTDFKELSREDFIAWTGATTEPSPNHVRLPYVDN